MEAPRSAGSANGAPAGAPGGKPERTKDATLHMGKIDPEQRKRRLIKNARNRGRRGEAMKKPCKSYEACNHKKHGKGK